MAGSAVKTVKPFIILSSTPAKAGICDKCGGELIQRSDDQGDTVKRRLEVYAEQTNPLIEYYEKQGVLNDIDGNRDSQAVFADIVKVMESL